jgi:2-dehydropantoate 2-reductase
MNTNQARILVIGAGVNGSICAVGLHQAGFDVTLLARGKRFEEVQNEGIIIEEPFEHIQKITRVAVIASLDPEDIYDYILVVIRKNQVADLLPTLAQNRSANVVFMVNNPSGPDEWVKFLGKERIMLGFVFGAGTRDGKIIRAITGIGTANSISGRFWPSPFGEIDGTVSPRLTRLVGILRQAGFPAGVSTHVVDYLVTHAAVVAVMASLLIQRGYDAASIARYSTADFNLLVDALRQALDVLRAVQRRITPPGIVAIKVIPRIILAALFRAVLHSKYAGVAGLWHISTAEDEMQQLGTEFMALVEKSGLPAPALRKLFAVN